MKLAALVLVALSLGGCASSAAPNYINGRYFLAGDPACDSYRVVNESRIMCMDKSKTSFSYRNAMSNDEMMMYQYGQRTQAMQMQQFGQSMQQASQAWQPQQVQQYSPPAVQPLTNPGSNQIRCISTGLYTNCR